MRARRIGLKSIGKFIDSGCTGLPFDRICFWLERMWRYKRISKNLEDYTVRRFGDIVEIRSLDKKKLYQLIVSKDFLRLEFIIAFEKLNEFFSELRALNYYFEGALTPLMWKLAECGKNGDCRTNMNGLVKGLYNIITVEGKMMVGVNFKSRANTGRRRLTPTCTRLTSHSRGRPPSIGSNRRRKITTVRA